MSFQPLKTSSDTPPFVRVFFIAAICDVTPIFGRRRAKTIALDLNLKERPAGAFDFPGWLTLHSIRCFGSLSFLGTRVFAAGRRQGSGCKSRAAAQL